MNKYINGYKVFGYETVSIIDNRLVNADSQDELIVVIDGTEQEPLKNYYKTVSSMLKNRCKIILITTTIEDQMFKALASLMSSYRAYDIYTVVSKDIITAPYLKAIENREPDFNEVQNYIGGDIAAYTELSNIIFGIEELSQAGDISRLSSFIQQHTSTLESLTMAIDYMKSICESYNSATLSDKIEKLEKLVERHKNEANKFNGQVQVLSEEKAQLADELKDLKLEAKKLRDNNEALKAVSDSDTKIITSFVPCRTTECECKVYSIIYFKEVSYVPYVNSLVTNLVEIYKKHGKKVKLLIYDNKTDLYETYKPLNIVHGKSFVASKDMYTKTVEKFVVAEPAPNIIKEIIGQDSAPDVLIIYDRMKTGQDIVEGNNVMKFFVINSKHDYEKLQKNLKIIDESKIITRSDEEFSNMVLDIPCVPGYKSSSESKKIVTYMRLNTAITKKPLIEEISNKSRIQLKGGR